MSHRATPAFPDHPTPGALSALGRVFRYVNSHAQLGLYTRCAEFALDGYMGASHGREIHRTASGVCRSRSGGYIFSFPGLASQSPLRLSGRGGGAEEPGYA